MALKSLCGLLLVVLIVTAYVDSKRSKPKRPSKQSGNSQDGQCGTIGIRKELKALRHQVHMKTHPIVLHVGGDHADFGHHGHDHSSHSNSTKADATKKDSPYHGGLAHGQHIHISFSLDKKECPYESHMPEDKFVYARCDMKESKEVSGSIFMRQKPHGAMESKMHLKGFKGPSEGTKDGKHDFFFDLHQQADFTNGCVSFGGHDHVHVHNHSKEADQETPQNDQPHGHSHDGHNHHGHNHAHGTGKGWGNIIINDKGVSIMEAKSTKYEMYGPDSIMGRGLVVHDVDDKIICCCAITFANIDDEGWKDVLPKEKP